uniref:Uncharacterized protein n=1 Tax=Meloidogyne enterolobii TaxID=390850 RepID=A0A6V7UQT4_MELEN|nr:unnamed protein product [Meloidogyne enterolobii]
MTIGHDTNEWILEIELGLEQGLDFSCTQSPGPGIFRLSWGFSWAWIFPGLQAQDPARVNKSNTSSRSWSRHFKNLDL